MSGPDGPREQSLRKHLGASAAPEHSTSLMSTSSPGPDGIASAGPQHPRRSRARPDLLHRLPPRPGRQAARAEEGGLCPSSRFFDLGVVGLVPPACPYIRTAAVNRGAKQVPEIAHRPRKPQVRGSFGRASAVASQAQRSVSPTAGTNRRGRHRSTPNLSGWPVEAQRGLTDIDDSVIDPTSGSRSPLASSPRHGRPLAAPRATAGRRAHAHRVRYDMRGGLG
jgi:hypothetical protein